MMTTLSEGNFLVVKLDFHVPTFTTVSAKILQNTKYALVIRREARIMKSLSHPNIIKLFHVVQRREATYLVMEYASEGELQDRVIKVGSLEESETRRLFAQIVHAVQYCHGHHIVHTDIKASNILIDCRGNAKLCDFDLAAEVIPGQKLAGFCGTLPRTPICRGISGPPMDIWSSS
ncbi:mCG1031292 [Mus musculus]|jgi:MAP/microtubule affinity-regulating kinase|nr:mCG1031292 [Mus musculus]